ncbi:MAG TPA: biotin--[acetyl-CoA-carboxylase] ligase [Tepidisphaeraceae bacterium]|nr:biotin--[acetyl-CoA-carboxylase] ligase [Tepidisphaeraceae bacterium]
MARKIASSFDLSRLRASLSPFRLHYFPTLRSTNSHAAVLRKRGDLFAPSIVLTPRQTAGRGRGSNSWSSPPGNLTVTFAFPVESQLQPHQLPLIAGLAIRSAAAELTGVPDIQLKWPNDLLHHHRKLAGILCERLDHIDLIGLGLNVNLDPRKAPKSLRDKLTSLRTIAGRPFDLTDTLLTIASHLRRTLSARHSQLFPTFLQEYDRHHALVGQTITILGSPSDPPLTGKCIGLDDTGRLLLKDRRNITHPIIAGHVLAKL